MQINSYIDIKKKAKKVLEFLKQKYPVSKTALSHKNPFELLVATILSARTTDNQVNKVTPQLFNKYPDVNSLANANPEDIEKSISSLGLYKNKAKNLILTAKIILEKFNGNVPDDLKLLTSLPGVGRKTASVILSNIYNLPAIAVDTHVMRISIRLGLTKNKSPAKIEKDLMKLYPKNQWSEVSNRFIAFGREICIAKNPKCNLCPFTNFCDFFLSKINT